ncbi:hypothetical protein DFH08DRAFT_945056 [Mycena albidolilacea]|uniref:Uncharacterized protein n=1 Tax=Mycena albidolilacea TaxID=1033008 RepID=A0AAD7E9F5_9AGAR|nr:hypothetical protein DFH08DRAFT_945056 [Mycena albidolilacea]
MRPFISRRKRRKLTEQSSSRGRRNSSPRTSSISKSWRWRRVGWRKKLVKRQKKAARERRKELKERLEREWAAMKERHAAEVEIWSVECSKLVAEGVKKKDLPPKPKPGKKPTVPVVDDEDDDLEDKVMDDSNV